MMRVLPLVPIAVLQSHCFAQRVSHANTESDRYLILHGEGKEGDMHIHRDTVARKFKALCPDWSGYVMSVTLEPLSGEYGKSGIAITATLATTQTPKCDDTNTAACQLLQTQNPDFCKDEAVVRAICPRFCKLCPMECYHCDTTYADYHLCNTTVLCQSGEVCMKKELTSFSDGHHEYELTCQDRRICDGGNDLTIPFGKRHVNSRDVSVTCCVDDFCNYPEQTTTSTTQKPGFFDACSIAPCDHGVCSSVPSGTFQCTCDPGFVGLLCDKHDPCTFKPCQHGKCSSFNNGTFSCTCDAGYNGLICEKVLGPCSSNPCQHGACLVNGNTYQCTCLTGYFGPQCDVKNACQPSPCLHGVCSPMNNGSYTCICSSGYSGINCDKASGPCTNSPCAHGTCLEVASSFVCLCDADYVGNLCDKLLGPCSSNPCQHGACLVNGNTYQCICNTGYLGPQCDAKDPCQPSPCHHGVCSPMNNGSYTCICSSGYSGSQCDTASGPCTNSPCAHGTCLEVASSFVCVCDAHYIGDLCGKFLGPCSPNPCQHGTCFDNGNTYQCTCLTGYFGPQCDVINPCHSSPCLHGVCSPMNNGSYTCICSSGYSGINCDTDVIFSTTTAAVTTPSASWLSWASWSCTDSLSGSCYHVRFRNCSSNDTTQCRQPGFTKPYEIVYCKNNTKCAGKIRDCKDVLDYHHAGGGGQLHNSIAIIELGGHPTNVLCDQHTAGGGWTVLMNRDGNSLHFPDKTYTDYTRGFGDIHGDFWAGLANMHNLTSDGRRYMLRVELQVANGTVFVANYDDFSIGQPDDFVLHIGSYHGDAGDSLSGHNGMGFTTKEVDHDINSINCGTYLQGAWWFHTCYDSCLTCPYNTPGSDNTHNCRVFSWNALGYCISLKSARLMMKPM